MLGWLVAFTAAATVVARSEDEFDAREVVRGSETLEVEALLAERFGSPFARSALLVISDLPSPLSASGAAALRAIIDSVERIPGVGGTLSFLETRDPIFVGAGGRGSIVLVGLAPENGRLDAMVPRLRATTESLAHSLRREFPGVALRWTGETPISFDLRRMSAEQVNVAQQRLAPVTLALLLVAFGSLAGALLPLIVGAVAITITLGLAVLGHRIWPLSVLLQNTVTTIGFGIGIHYSLLTVSRFREALATGATATAAARSAAELARPAIARSGAVVGIGFGALLLFPLNELASVGLGGILVVVISLLIATTLLPAILSWLGARVDAGRLPLPRRRIAAASATIGARAGATTGATTGATIRATTGTGKDARVSEGGWTRWGRLVARRPWVTLIVAASPLVLLSLPALRLSTALPQGDWLPERMESAIALQEMTQMERGGFVNRLHLIVEMPVGVNLLDPAGWAAMHRLTTALADDPRVTRAQSITSILPFPIPPLQLLSIVPADVRRSLISSDGGAGVIEVVPRDSLELNTLSELVRELRGWDIGGITGVPGASVLVGGRPAANADYADAISTRVGRVATLLLGMTFVTLALAFRSVLLPVQIIALNLLSASAAFGAVVLVFQDGHGAALLGLSGPLGGVSPAVPVPVFSLFFALSMVSAVFLISRVAEAREAMGESDAIVHGLAMTGRVITSAAAIMIAAFAAFILGDFVTTKIFGFALASALLVDATIVRLAIAPALLHLAGRWNWWPGRRSS